VVPGQPVPGARSASAGITALSSAEIACDLKDPMPPERCRRIYEWYGGSSKVGPEKNAGRREMGEPLPVRPRRVSWIMADGHLHLGKNSRKPQIKVGDDLGESSLNVLASRHAAAPVGLRRSAAPLVGVLFEAG
jgi:hypothetical protein